jgi:hypothetical protein
MNIYAPDMNERWKEAFTVTEALLSKFKNTLEGNRQRYAFSRNYRMLSIGISGGFRRNTHLRSILRTCSKRKLPQNTHLTILHEVKLYIPRQQIGKTLPELQHTHRPRRPFIYGQIRHPRRGFVLCKSRDEDPYFSRSFFDILRFTPKA